MNESKVLSWVESLTNKEFAEFFYRAVANRSTSDPPDWKGHFILAVAEKVTDEPWNIDLVANYDTDEYGEWADDSPFCQQGNCSACGNSVRSIAKHAICPVCKSKAYCT